MDQIINQTDGSLTDVEKDLFESLLSGTIPGWLNARMNAARIDAETRAFGSAKRATAPTMNNHTVEAPSPSPEASATRVSSSPSFGSMHPTMPLNGTSPPETTNSLRGSDVIGKRGEARHMISQSNVKSTEVPSFAKRRAGELESFELVKRMRHWEENIDPRLQVEEQVFGPHFIGPDVSTSVPLPTNSGPIAGLRTASGPARDEAAFAFAATHDNSVSRSQQANAVIPTIYYGATAPVLTARPASASIGNDPVRTSHPLPTPALPSCTAEKNEPQARSGEKIYKLKPTTRRALEDSDDPARQKTIRAHRANDARQNHTDDIICLWIDAGAEQPCHLSFKGTDALLVHCVKEHGVPSAKDVKEKGACGWDDCPASMAKGGLKRHLEESGLHGRLERIKSTKKNKGGS